MPQKSLALSRGGANDYRPKISPLLLTLSSNGSEPTIIGLNGFLEAPNDDAIKMPDDVPRRLS